MDQSGHMRLACNPALILRNEFYSARKFFAFDAQACTTHSISREQFALLSNLRNQSVEQKDLAKVAEIFFDEATGDLHRLCDERLLLPSSSEPIRYECLLQVMQDIYLQPDNRAPINAYTFPTDIDIIVTRRCNMACDHCNVSAIPLHKGGELAAADWGRIFGELEERNVFRVVMSGGEPFVHREFEALLDEFLRRRFYKIILTTGYFLDEQTCIKLANNNVALGLSLDGSSSDVHDVFRRSAGAFERLRHSLEMCKRFKIRYAVSVTVHKGSLSQLNAIVDLVRPFSPEAIVFNPIEQVGRAVKHQQWTLSSPELSAASQKIDELRKLLTDEIKVYFNTKGMTDPVEVLTSRMDVPSVSSGFCKAGTKGLVIGPNGDLFACMYGFQNHVTHMRRGRATMQELWGGSALDLYRKPVEDLWKFKGCRVDFIKGQGLIDRP